MLSPEVWNFTAPTPIISYKTYNSDKDAVGAIKRQLFTHHVSITLPNTLKAPEDLIKILSEDTQYYRINNVPVSEIFDRTFINLFIKNGAFTSLSIKASYSDSCFAFIPTGKLILCVNEKIFQELGLESLKKRSSNYGKTIVLDVINGCEYLKKYESTKQKLLHKRLIFDIILAWEPYDSVVCPSSIAAYFFQKGYFIKTCDIKFQQRLNYNIKVPIYDDKSDYENLMEWLAAFNLQCNMFDDNFISTFNFTDDNELLGQVYYASFTGFLTNSRVEKLIVAISEFIRQQEFSSWVGLVINGFKGSFLSGKSENFFQYISDHHHTIIFKNGQPKLIQFFQISEK